MLPLPRRLKEAKKAKAAEEKAAKEAEKKAKAEADKKAKEEAAAKKKAKEEAKKAAAAKPANKEEKKKAELKRVKERSKSIDFKVLGNGQGQRKRRPPGHQGHWTLHRREAERSGHLHACKSAR